MRHTPSRTRPARPATSELRQCFASAGALHAPFKPLALKVTRTHRRRHPLDQLRGFTLPELLVVIGIMGVLVALLVPVVGSLRKKAQATTTLAEIRDIGVMIQAYHHDFKAYPGPIPNVQLGSEANGVKIGWADDRPNPEPDIYIFWSPAHITMAENLVLGLFGGLKPVGPPGTYHFVWINVGEGPRTFGQTHKKLPPYGNVGEVSLSRSGLSGLLRGSAPPLRLDSQVPEFLDRFPEPLPYLYLRARPGMTGVVSTGPATPAPGAQYDLSQVLPYTSPDSADRFLGEGKEDDGEPRVLPPEAKGNPLSHGFIAAPVATATLDPASVGYTYPYNIHAALRNPASGPPGSPAAAALPREKDGYILISAGIDRIYGTRDDITSFGSY